MHLTGVIHAKEGLRFGSTCLQVNLGVYCLVLSTKHDFLVMMDTKNTSIAR